MTSDFAFRVGRASAPAFAPSALVALRRARRPAPLTCCFLIFADISMRGSRWVQAEGRRLPYSAADGAA
jgi:hypothetical protein